MNIYFACSITGGREFEAVCQSIVGALTRDGHEVPTGHFSHSEPKSCEYRHMRSVTFYDG